MSVKIESTVIKNEFRAESVDFLLANVGDKITIETIMRVETSVIASTDNEIIMNIKDGFIPPAGQEWIFDAASRFADFREGDLIYIAEYNPFVDKGLFTILEKIDENAIRITPPTGFAAGAVGVRIAISVAVPITAIQYKYNFIENDDQPTFQSLTSETEQVLSAEGLDADVTTPKAMIFEGKRDYQIGSATIEGIEILDSADSSEVYISRFKIIHNTFLTPFLLAPQWDDILIDKAPEYFFNQKALKAIFDIEAMYLANDPNKIQMVSVEEVKGNTGWLDENFNTGLTNYTVDSVVYQRTDLSVITAIELSGTSETTITIVIKNTVDSPFSNNNTKFTLNFVRSPFDADEYTDNDNLLLENFVFDRALQTLGSPDVDGDNFGTTHQVLKDIAGVFVSASEIKITAVVDFGVDALAKINQSDEKRYMIFVAVQDHTLATSVSDKVAIKAASRDFFIDNTDPTMIGITSLFIRHPHTLPIIEGVSSVTVFPEDELVSFHRFFIDRNGRVNDDISIRSITLKVKAKNSSTLEEFDLDSFTFDATTLPIINDHQFVDETIDRVFHIPPAEIRKSIKIQRRIDLDSGNKFFYDIFFPYLIRWEDWVALSTANQDFFDTGEPNNGLNEFWHRYSTIANWDLFTEIIINTTKNDNALIFSKESIIESQDYNTNPDWINETIRTFDPDTGNPLTDGGTKHFLLGFKDTRVEAIFESSTGTPVIANVTVVLGIEVFEEGGIQGRRRMSSKFASGSDTWFKSLDTTNKTKLTALSGDRIKAEALVDFTQLPNKGKFKIVARIYEIEPIEGKGYQDDVEFAFQDDDEYNFQDQ